MRNALAFVQLGQAGVHLCQKDEPLDSVIKRCVSREILEGVEYPVSGRLGASHIEIVPLSSPYEVRLFEYLSAEELVSTTLESQHTLEYWALSRGASLRPPGVRQAPPGSTVSC